MEGKSSALFVYLLLARRYDCDAMLFAFVQDFLLLRCQFLGICQLFYNSGEIMRRRYTLLVQFAEYCIGKSKNSLNSFGYLLLSFEYISWKFFTHPLSSIPTLIFFGIGKIVNDSPALIAFNNRINLFVFLLIWLLL